MNRNTKLAAVLLLALLMVQPSSIAFAQGSLTPPPGKVGPTMKSLAEIEARTPISHTPFVISQPGSYYLTTNLTVNFGDAIRIQTNNVTVDLNGYTIASTTASAAGYAIVLYGGVRNATIQNGFIQSGVTNNGSGTYNGSGFGYGISYNGNAPKSIHVKNIGITGCLYYGIYLGQTLSTTVESCDVETMGSYGIIASTIKNSIALDCGADGIFGNLVENCRGECSGSGYGIHGGNVLNSYGVSAQGTGLYAYTAENCRGQANGTGIVYGIYAQVAHNCRGASNGRAGIYTYYAAQNCYGISSYGYGIESQNVLNSYGYSSGSYDGIFAANAENCYGNSTTNGTGINASQAAQNCYGYGGTGIQATTALNCSGASAGGDGIFARENAENCYGSSGSYYGIYCNGVTTGCYGYSQTDYYAGLHAGWLAIGCYGQCPASKGVETYTAINCFGLVNYGGTPIAATNKVHCFP